jgi:hypothetical protein
VKGNSRRTRSKHEGTLPCRGGSRPDEGNANTARRWRCRVRWPQLNGIGHAGPGVPHGRYLTASSSAGRDQEDGLIAEVNSFGTAAGGQEAVEDIVGDGLTALALRISS